MYSQNDDEWMNEPLNKSRNTIGQVGCLLTSLINIFKTRYPDIDITPLSFNQNLIDNNGYTDGNLVIWSVVEDLLGVDIEHIFTGFVEYDLNSFYIANFKNPNTGHFTNVISKDGNKYNIFDVWDGKYKTIIAPRRLVKVRFK